VLVVVTGANGPVGSRLCVALAERGASVRAVVRRTGAAPAVPGVAERVGDFTDTGFAASVLAGADAAVTTVHPMGSDGEVQRRIGVEGTARGGPYDVAAARQGGRGGALSGPAALLRPVPRRCGPTSWPRWRLVGSCSFCRAAAAAGVERFIHVSTAAVYDRSPGVGDVDESSPLVGDDAGDYPVTKRDADSPSHPSRG
jgi:nucleoside-diphosphate-sugar epimerase